MGNFPEIRNRVSGGLLIAMPEREKILIVLCVWIVRCVVCKYKLRA